MRLFLVFNEFKFNKINQNKNNNIKNIRVYASVILSVLVHYRYFIIAVRAFLLRAPIVYSYGSPHRIALC